MAITPTQETTTTWLGKMSKREMTRRLEERESICPWIVYLTNDFYHKCIIANTSELVFLEIRSLI